MWPPDKLAEPGIRNQMTSLRSSGSEEKKRMIQWNLTAKTYMHVEDWKKFFNEAGYKGDYYWFFPE